MVTGADLGFSEGAWKAKPNSESLKQGEWKAQPPETITNSLLGFQVTKSKV